MSEPDEEDDTIEAVFADPFSAFWEWETPEGDEAYKNL
jgi:hypothetical protein